MNAAMLLEEISQACRELRMAETTFGRLAVNDGKFVSRLRQGGRVTIQTVERVCDFIQRETSRPSTLRHFVLGLSGDRDRARDFRFYDNRQKYLLFVSTCSEKWIIADRVSEELNRTRPSPPAIRLFDAGAGDGTVLARVMRSMHRRFRWMPFFVVAKEVSLENVRLTLEKMPDRFHEHPATVLVMTNLRYSEAPWLQPKSVEAATAMVWHEVALQGDCAADFETQISALQPFLARHWQAEISPVSGNPVPEKPVALVLYREDHRFPLAGVVPRRGEARADFDMVIVSQPYRARAPLKFKAERILAPLARSLRPGGRLVGVQSFGRDPGLELVQAIWPDEDPFTLDRHVLLRSVRQALGSQSRDLRFNAFGDSRALFRYEMHTLPNEISSSEAAVGTSTLLAAWNAATYVAQIEDSQLTEAMTNDLYLDRTRETLRKYNGLWFLDEMFVISRKGEFD